MNYKSILLVLFAFAMLNACKQSGETASTAKHSAKTEVKKELTKKRPPAKKSNQSATLAGSNVDWLSIEDIDKMGNKDGKMYIIDVYTDWCGWCKVMDKQTFATKEFQDYAMDKFHMVKFNAEQKDPINFKGKTYEWTPAGRKGVNKLAMELLGGRLSYPSLVYLDKDMNKIKVSPGFKKPAQLIEELKSL